jgi:hypothetical protein
MTEKVNGPRSFENFPFQQPNSLAVWASVTEARPEYLLAMRMPHFG